jgi:hypothetical protein
VTKYVALLDAPRSVAPAVSAAISSGFAAYYASPECCGLIGDTPINCSAGITVSDVHRACPVAYATFSTLRCEAGCVCMYVLSTCFLCEVVDACAAGEMQCLPGSVCVTKTQSCECSSGFVSVGTVPGLPNMHICQEVHTKNRHSDEDTHSDRERTSAYYGSIDHQAESGKHPAGMRPNGHRSA